MGHKTSEKRYVARTKSVQRLAQQRDDARDALARIAQIIEQVYHRCQAADGPVTPTMQEMTQDELSRIYALAMGKPETWRP